MIICHGAVFLRINTVHWLHAFGLQALTAQTLASGVEQQNLTCLPVHTGVHAHKRDPNWRAGQSAASMA